jgi:methylated-DNA-[protein]-cysteine S-methyltransferase
MNLFFDTLSSPLGEISFVWENGVLRALDFDDCAERMERLLRAHYPHHRRTPLRAPDEIRSPLVAYFDGDVSAITRIPAQASGTPFQLRVWAALREIPVGQTTTYGALAARIGNPAASRAVGLANGANPIGVVVPCHRVIGANGALVGYAGGVERKRWLLAHERAGLSSDAHLTRSHASAHSGAPVQSKLAF